MDGTRNDEYQERMRMGWAKFDDAYTDHPKVAEAGPMAELLDMRAILHCARYETDGFVKETQLARLAVGIPKVRQQVDALVRVGRWVRDDEAAGWHVHDFLDYHPTHAEQEAKRKAARERMANRRQNKRAGSREVRANTSGTSSEVREKFNDPVPDPVPQSKNTTSDAAPPHDEVAHMPPQVSDEAQTLTRLFAELAKTNGHSLPKRGTKAHGAWLIEMDRLLRIGPKGGTQGASVEDVEAVIRWCAEDRGSGAYPGESVNVASVPKLRERWTNLRGKWQASTRTGERVSMRDESGAVLPW